jgi:hypothetical protein
VKSFDPTKVEVLDCSCSTIQEAINELTAKAMNLQRNLAVLYECEIEDTEIVLDVEDETKLTMTARLKNGTS